MPRRVRGRVDADKPLAPMTWAQRLKRVFAIDIEACPHCGGTLRVIACVEEPWLIRKILGHVQRRDALSTYYPLTWKIESMNKPLQAGYFLASQARSYRLA